jgi:peptidoglycan/LPS O-acetylase OafA/YrhL
MSQGIIETRRLTFIDSLRGFAAVYVILYHLALIPAFKPIVPEYFQPIIMNGGTGVTLFFVISAFTLCYTLEPSLSKTNSIFYFYLKRIFRILPLYYLWLIFMCFYTYGLEILPNLWWNKKELALYAFFGFNFFPGKQAGIVWASWTLGIEMIFYLAFPLIFILCNTLLKSIVFLGFSFFLAYYHSILTSEIPNYVGYFGILHHLPVFAVGILCYFIFKSVQALNVRKIWGYILLAGGIALFFLIPFKLGHESVFPVIYAMSICYAIIFFGLYFLGPNILATKFSAYIGTISYSLYLNHPLIIHYSTNIYKYIYSLNFSNTVSYFLCFLAALCPLVVLSILTYEFIELPGMAMGRRLIRKIKSVKPENELVGTN